MKPKVYITKSWIDCPDWWRKMILHLRETNHIDEDETMPGELIVEELARHNAIQERYTDLNIDWSDKKYISRQIIFDTEADYVALVLKWS